MCLNIYIYIYVFPFYPILFLLKIGRCFEFAFANKYLAKKLPSVLYKHLYIFENKAFIIFILNIYYIYIYNPLNTLINTLIDDKCLEYIYIITY